MASQRQGGELCWARLAWHLPAVWATRQEALLHSRNDRVASAGECHWPVEGLVGRRGGE